MPRSQRTGSLKDNYSLALHTDKHIVFDQTAIAEFDGSGKVSEVRTSRPALSNAVNLRLTSKSLNKSTSDSSLASPRATEPEIDSFAIPLFLTRLRMAEALLLLRPGSYSDLAYFEKNLARPRGFEPLTFCSGGRGWPSFPSVLSLNPSFQWFRESALHWRYNPISCIG